MADCEVRLALSSIIGKLNVEAEVHRLIEIGKFGEG